MIFSNTILSSSEHYLELTPKHEYLICVAQPSALSLGGLCRYRSFTHQRKSTRLIRSYGIPYFLMEVGISLSSLKQRFSGLKTQMDFDKVKICVRLY
jgi:hypothetical protein